MYQLPRISLEKELGSLESQALSFHLLQQDSDTPLLPPTRMMSLIHQAIAVGEKWAEPFVQNISFTKLANILIRDGIQVLLQDQNKELGGVRAEYNHKQRRITIYRSSFKQLDRFFREQGYQIEEEEWLLLHLTHEFFHHLERKPKNRREFRLPRITFRRLGPLRFQRPLFCVSEIAAHTFTQKALSLSWSPYLLDLWVELHKQGGNIKEIQSSLAKIQNSYDLFCQQMEEALVI